MALRRTSTPTVYVVALNPHDLEAPFIRPHLDRLPARTVAVHGVVPTVGTPTVLSTVGRVSRKLLRFARRQPWVEEVTQGYVAAFSARPAVVLAEFGPTGVRLIDACRRTGLPLIVHFHGYDYSKHEVLEENRESYPRLFEAAAAIVVVSRNMRDALVDLGAPPHKVHYCPYGVDCDQFQPGSPATAPPEAIAVGRFVDKKAPHLTILAFAKARQAHPSARLRMTGDGALLGSCQDLVTALGIEDAVTFMGHQEHAAIAGHMRTARCFVQHSVQALNGDCEGTPNAVLEAGASGLPCVVTRHAGIPDVVCDGLTGILVEERDVDAMAEGLSKMFGDPLLAARLGAAARDRIVSEFAMELRLHALWRVIEDAQATFAQATETERRQYHHAHTYSAR
jgi:colanic acid/amylovoran biosynthesis glycosyltransferase